MSWLDWTWDISIFGESIDMIFVLSCIVDAIIIGVAVNLAFQWTYYWMGWKWKEGVENPFWEKSERNAYWFDVKNRLRKYEK